MHRGLCLYHVNYNRAIQCFNCMQSQAGFTLTTSEKVSSKVCVALTVSTHPPTPSGGVVREPERRSGSRWEKVSAGTWGQIGNRLAFDKHSHQGRGVCVCVWWGRRGTSGEVSQVSDFFRSVFLSQSLLCISKNLSWLKLKYLPC